MAREGRRLVRRLAERELSPDSGGVDRVPEEATVVVVVMPCSCGVGGACSLRESNSSELTHSRGVVVVASGCAGKCEERGCEYRGDAIPEAGVRIPEDI